MKRRIKVSMLECVKNINDIGPKLKEIRKLCGVKQSDIVKKLNITSGAVSSFEKTGDRFLPKIKQYVEVLGGSLTLQAGKGYSAVRLKDVGPDLKMIREMYKKSRKVIAKNLDIWPCAVEGFEKNGNNSKLSTIEQYVKVLGQSFNISVEFQANTVANTVLGEKIREKFNREEFNIVCNDRYMFVLPIVCSEP